MSKDLQQELRVAMGAVRHACAVCRAVQADLVTAETLQKKDKSPVTVADFASQAKVCAALAAAFPDDPVVGEEGADELRRPENAGLLGGVVKHAQMTEADTLAAIERGGYDPAAEGGASRYWTLDPIDGTKGFLRGEQYAVALGLIVDGRVVLGVLGCPNLPTGDGGTGVIMAAASGEASGVASGGDAGTSGGGGGAMVYRLDDAHDAGAPIHVSDVRQSAGARFCESVESGHTDQDASVQIAKKLGITNEPFRIDSQCKYAAVARGDAEIYLRLPTRPGYQEKIWDHAAGVMVMIGAGGRVTDVTGKDLDFSLGRTLSSNKGVIATCGPIHDQVVAAVREVLGV